MNKPLTTAELSRAAGITPARVRQLAWRMVKLGYGHKIGRDWMWNESAIDYLKIPRKPGNPRKVRK